MFVKIRFVIILILSTLSLTAIEKAVLRIPNPSKELIHIFTSEHYDIAAYNPEHFLDILIPIDKIPEIQRQYPNAYITQTENQLKENLKSKDRNLNGYRSYDALIAELNTLATQHSNIMTIFDLGITHGAQYLQLGYTSYSNYNHHIWAAKVSDNPTLEEDEPSIFFFGNFHAREPLGVETTMTILLEILNNYQSDPWVQNIINNAQIWFVPMVNPDGHRIVWTESDIWWRKNLRDNNNTHDFETDNNFGMGADGVDLNRNWGFEWGYMSASDDPNYVTYHGPNPFSEPECQIIKDLLNTHHFVAGISFHTYSQLVLYPFGYVGDVYAPDVVELSDLANQMAAIFPAQGGGTYTPQASWQLYPVSGGLDDWAYGKKGIFCYTIELGTQFIPNATTVNLICNRVKLPAKKLMDRINKAMLKGHITDASTGEPLVATIHVNQVDNVPSLREPYKSNSLYGSYYRFLSAGTYNVRFFKEGYLPYETQVTIYSDSVTILDVQLTPAEVVTLNGWISTFGDVPLSGVTVEFLDTQIPIQITDENGNFSINNFPYGYYSIRLYKSGFETVVYNQLISEPYIAFLMSNSPNLTYDFESSIADWTTNGTWNVTSAHAHSGQRSLTDRPNLNYSDNTDSWIKLTQSLSLIGYQNANISFYIKTFIALDGDYCALEYSTDGVIWRVWDYYTGNTDWTEKNYNLNHFLGQNIQIRFHLVSNDNGAAEGVYIDDFRFYGNGMIVGNQEIFNPLPIAYLHIFPNPTAGITLFSLSLNDQKALQTEISIYNLKGQKVNTILDTKMKSGMYSFSWEGKDYQNKKVTNGIYIVVLKLNGKHKITKKLVMIK